MLSSPDVTSGLVLRPGVTLVEIIQIIIEIIDYMSKTDVKMPVCCRFCCLSVRRIELRETLAEN